MTKVLVDISESENITSCEYRSLLNSGVYLSRAENLAEIFRFDHETYGDINIETIIIAAKLAGFLDSTSLYTKTKIDNGQSI